MGDVQRVTNWRLVAELAKDRRRTEWLVRGGIEGGSCGRELLGRGLLGSGLSLMTGGGKEG